MYEKFIQERINELRMKKNISEYQLSLELGRSQGYVTDVRIPVDLHMTDTLVSAPFQSSSKAAYSTE